MVLITSFIFSKVDSLVRSFLWTGPHALPLIPAQHAAVFLHIPDNICHSPGCRCVLLPPPSQFPHVPVRLKKSIVCV